MSYEIVRRLRENKQKLIFENVESPDVDELTQDIEEGLDISSIELFKEKDGKMSLRLSINGIEYRYRSLSMLIEDLLKKFKSIYKHSEGAALSWLKKNSYVYYNGRTKVFAEAEELPAEEDDVSLEEDSPEERDKGYLVRYVYDGDSLSDYQGSILVRASSEREAIKRAEKEVLKSRADARFFTIEKKIPSIRAWRSQYPRSNIKILEGRYTGTTTVRRIAEKVLQNHSLKNTAGQYDKFVNKMWNLYKETLLDERKLEEVMEREFKKMYPNLSEGIVIEPGNNFKNAGYSWRILAVKGDYTLVYAKDKKLHPYVVAWKLDKRDGSWGQGHYFEDEASARKFMAQKSGERYMIKSTKSHSKDSDILENADMELLDDGKDKDNLGANIIRAIYEPVSTADKPNIADAVNESEEGDSEEDEELENAIKEAFSGDSPERKFTEPELIKYLQHSEEPVVYIRTTYFKGGWDDVQFAAVRGGYSVSLAVDRKDILRKLGLSGTFADFYVFTKKTVRESKKLKETVDVNTSRWSYALGRKAPSGRGIWYFKIGTDEVSFSGLYSDAKKQAISYAKQRKIQSITLLP